MSGLIKEFVIGEQWSKFDLRTITLIDQLPRLYNCTTTRISNAQSRTVNLRQRGNLGCEAYNWAVTIKETNRE
jgi:hypothetical protein